MSDNRTFFQKWIDDLKKSGVSLIKSQVIIAALTFIMMIIAFWIIKLPYENYQRILIALGIAVVDFIPMIGCSIVMLPWAAYQLIAGDETLGLHLFFVYLVVMIIKQIIEPLIRGDKMGLSPIESAVSAVAGYAFFNGIGIILGPVLLIAGKSAYKLFFHKEIEGEKKAPEVTGTSKSTNQNKESGNPDIIDITNDVEEVEEKKND